jgi:hypothetical protein
MQKDYAAGLELVTLRTAERFAREFNFSIDTSLSLPPLPPVNAAPRSGGGEFLRSSTSSSSSSSSPFSRTCAEAWRT